MKIIDDTFSSRIIDLDFAEYTVTFKMHGGFETIIKGIHSATIQEAIEQAEITLYNYYEIQCTTNGLDYTADEMIEQYYLSKIERI